MNSQPTPTISQMFPLDMRHEFFRRIYERTWLDPSMGEKFRNKPWTLFLHSRMTRAKINDSLKRFYDYTDDVLLRKAQGALKADRFCNKKPVGRVDVKL